MITTEIDQKKNVKNKKLKKQTNQKKTIPRYVYQMYYLVYVDIQPNQIGRKHICPLGAGLASS